VRLNTKQHLRTVGNRGTLLPISEESFRLCQHDIRELLEARGIFHWVDV
jgi:hypothetical protein